MAAVAAVKAIPAVLKRLAVKVEAVKELHSPSTLLVKMVELILVVALVVDLPQVVALDLLF